MQIAKEHLKDVQVTVSKGLKSVVREGKKLLTQDVYTRPATEEDILSCRDYGGYIIFTTCDGRKIRKESHAVLK